MRVVLQRVASASVSVGGSVTASIGRGVVCLVGLGRDDTIADDGAWCARKLLNLRLWPSESGEAWRECVKSLGAEVLLVSQFTLYANVKKNKPNYAYAMKTDAAAAAFDDFVELVKAQHSPDLVKTGVFGAMMQVQLVNDGPVTIELDSLQRNFKAPPKPEAAPKKAGAGNKAQKKNRTAKSGSGSTSGGTAAGAGAGAGVGAGAGAGAGADAGSTAPPAGEAVDGSAKTTEAASTSSVVDSEASPSGDSPQ